MILDYVTKHVRPFRDGDFPVWRVWTWAELRQRNDDWILENLLKWIARLGIVSAWLWGVNQNIIGVSKKLLQRDQGQVRPTVRCPSIPFCIFKPVKYSIAQNELIKSDDFVGFLLFACFTSLFASGGTETLL